MLFLILHFNTNIKSKFKENYFNHLGRYEKHNYFPIKKEIIDSSLIIRIEMIDYLDFNIMYLIPHKIEEINSEFNQIIKGPKYYYIDYFKFNNMNSIGFLANESFFFFEEKIEYITYASSYYDNIFITSLNNYMANSFKNAIIYFNSSNNILFEIKKYNYSFLDKDPNQYIPDYEYFQLCQGNDTLDELYFYRKNYDIFQPVFGSFDSYFIKKTDIKTLSDLYFDKISSSYYTLNKNIGFLKIKCKAPLMLKHLFWSDNAKYHHKLNSGIKYYLNLEWRNQYTFDDSLVGKDLQIKITILGLPPNQIIKFVFNNTAYNLTNKPFEFNFTYINYENYLFYFEIIDKNIDYIIIAEINIGLLPEIINETFTQLDFIDSLGTLNIKRKKAKKGEDVIIKIPKNFNKNLFDYSIYFRDFIASNNILVDISFDKLEFQTICYKIVDRAPTSIPLFRVNPYDYIQNNSSESNNKFFYILIYSGYLEVSTVYIKKPMIYTDAKFNTINYLEKLTGNDDKYYYQIKFPKSDENYKNLIIQIEKSDDIVKTLSKQNIQYSFYSTHFLTDYSDFHDYVIPFDKNNFDYFNYINHYSKNGYINFIQTNERIYPYINSKLDKFVKNIQQIKGKNKLKIELDSLSYKYNKNIVNYYLLINFGYFEASDFYSKIGSQTEPYESYESSYKLVIILEDNGLNETFSKEIEINKDLIDGNNTIYIVPIFNKTNLFLDYYKTRNILQYEKISKKSKSKLLYILIPIISAIIIIIVILLILRHRKKTSKGITVDKVLNEELTEIDK